MDIVPGYTVKIQAENNTFIWGLVKEVRNRTVIVKIRGLDEEVDRDLIVAVHK